MVILASQYTSVYRGQLFVCVPCVCVCVLFPDSSSFHVGKLAKPLFFETNGPLPTDSADTKTNPIGPRSEWERKK